MHSTASQEGTTTGATMSDSLNVKGEKVSTVAETIVRLRSSYDLPDVVSDQGQSGTSNHVCQQCVACWRDGYCTFFLQIVTASKFFWRWTAGLEARSDEPAKSWPYNFFKTHTIWLNSITIGSFLISLISGMWFITFWLLKFNIRKWDQLINFMKNWIKNYIWWVFSILVVSYLAWILYIYLPSTVLSTISCSSYYCRRSW